MMRKPTSSSLSPPTRAWVLRPTFGNDSGGRLPESRLAEAKGLTSALGVTIVGAECVPLRKPRPSTLFGRGAVTRLADAFEKSNTGLAVVDSSLTPVQQRNLERFWACKVLDRSGLILEIFGERAQTTEGRLQVEHAHLTYQMSRLVRSWTHLERQRGGYGFLGGPGETQIESDRRMIRNRLSRLDQELEKAVQRRAIQRSARASNDVPTVALVGYTNAGKSTLFNRICDAKVFARDMPFATLDPTVRAVKLPSGRRIALADTVGFISELPVELVKAFRATLGEVRHAGLLLHVIDASSEEMEIQYESVMETLESIGVLASSRVLDVYNKCDRLSSRRRSAMAKRIMQSNEGVLISAAKGDGIETLFERIAEAVRSDVLLVDLTLAPDAGEALAWLYRHSSVSPNAGIDTGIKVTVEISKAGLNRFLHRYGQAVAEVVSCTAAQREAGQLNLSSAGDANTEVDFLGAAAYSRC